MESKGLSVHELLEITEFISEEMIVIKKISANINIAQDKDLKDFMQESVTSKKNALKHLQSALFSQMSNMKKEVQAMSNNTQLTDKDIVLDLLGTSNATITTLSKTLMETTNAQIRARLSNQLNTSIISYRKLLDMAISKGWYDAYADPNQQLQSELDAISSLPQN
jgi:similar to spore coat protein